MWILGVLVLVIACVMFLLARSSRGTMKMLSAVSTVSCGEVAALAEMSAMCEVAGTAMPAPNGPLTSPLSNTPCVWYRVVVVEKYREQNSDGASNQQTRTVSDTASEQAFWVKDASGQVIVMPARARVDAPQKSYDQFEPNMGGFGIGMAEVSTSFGSQTEGFQRTEWTIPPDQMLFVSGQASASQHGAAIGKPTKGNMTISLRSEEELMASEQKKATLLSIGSAVLAVAGVVLVVIGLS